MERFFRIMIPAVIIPCCNPGVAAADFIGSLRQRGSWPLIVVNDGSRTECDSFFEEVRHLPGCTVLTHAVNLGKGRALKTAFNHCLQAYPGGCGAVTADCDGQHLPEDVARIAQVLAGEQDSLILGVRDFSGKDIPWKNLAGNRLTGCLLSRMLNCRISDTQTGLRGIPVPLMKILMNTPGERFEFETRMLLEARLRGFGFRQIPIRTRYLNGNRESHFRPAADSLKICGVILRHLFRNRRFSMEMNDDR